MLFVLKFILLIILINNCNCSIIPDGQGIYRTDKKTGNPGEFLTSNYIAVREVINLPKLGMLTVKLFVFSSKKTVENDVIRYETIKKLPEYSTYHFSGNSVSLLNATYECENLTSDYPTFTELFERCNKTQSLMNAFGNETRYFDVYKKNESICYRYNNLVKCGVKIDNEDRILKQFGIETKDDDDKDEVNAWMIIGIMIGVFLLLVVIIITLYVIFERRRKVNVNTAKSSEKGIRVM